MAKDMTLKENENWNIIRVNLFNQRQEKITNSENDNLIFIANSENTFAYSFAYLLFSNQITYISKNEFYLGDKDFVFTKELNNNEIKIVTDCDNRFKKLVGFTNKKQWFFELYGNYRIKSNFPINARLPGSELTNGFILDLENFKVE